MEFQPLSRGSKDLVGYDRPEMMAIGDSLYNGTRSLTTGGGLEQLAVPAMVARSLGIGSKFRIPNYPRKVLFDLEQHLRVGLDFQRFREECLSNANLWLQASGVWSNQKFFDNIAIAGAEIKDLWENTSGSFKIKAQNSYYQILNSPGIDIKAIGDLYYALNVSFLLNPSGDPDLDDLTPLEQVASRRPKRLLISIGSNNGLFRCGMNAKMSREDRSALENIPALVQMLADILKKYCSDVEHIYFNSLIRPRAIANLAPRTDEEMYNPPGGGDYFGQYVGRLGSPVGMSKSQMKDLDDLVNNINEECKKIIGKTLKGRAEFVDIYDWAGDLDRKHGTEKNPVYVQHGGVQKRLSNYPLSTLFGRFKQGGLFSLDNMHPTTVGYALLSERVCQAITAKEGIDSTPYSVQDAYEVDSLLQDLPSGWDTLNLGLNILSSIRSIGLALSSR